MVEIKAAKVDRATGLRGGNGRVGCAANTREEPAFRLRTPASATFSNSSRGRLRSAAREKPDMTTCACGDSVKMKEKRRGGWKEGAGEENKRRKEERKKWGGQSEEGATIRRRKKE